MKFCCTDVHDLKARTSTSTTPDGAPEKSAGQRKGAKSKKRYLASLKILLWLRFFGDAKFHPAAKGGRQKGMGKESDQKRQKKIDQNGYQKVQKGISPELRATWLSSREKKMPLLGIFCLFSCVWDKTVRKKPALNPGTRVSLAKFWPKGDRNRKKMTYPVLRNPLLQHVESFRVGSRQNRIFYGFLSLAHRIFLADFISSFLWGKKCTENPPGKFPAKSSKIYTTKIPDTFLQTGRAKKFYSTGALHALSSGTAQTQPQP